MQSIFPCVFFCANSVTKARHKDWTRPKFPDSILSEDSGAQVTAPLNHKMHKTLEGLTLCPGGPL